MSQVLEADDSPAQPYRMRLSNIDTLVDKIDDFSMNERRRPIEAHLGTKLQETPPLEEEKKHRKSSDVLLGDNPQEFLKNSVIKKYSNDLIYKRPVLTLKKKRERDTSILSSFSSASTKCEESCYLMKNKTGLRGRIPFIENRVQKRFYEYFDSQVCNELSLFPKVTQKKDENHLCDFHIDPPALQKQKSLFKPRRLKRQTHNSMPLPDTFLPTIAVTREHSSKSVNSNSVRRSPSHIINQTSNILISPFRVKSKTGSSNTLEDKELPKEVFVENNDFEDLPLELEDNDSPLGFEGSLKRQLSSDIFNRKTNFRDRMSMGHVHLRSEQFRGSFDLDSRFDTGMGIERVQSVVVKKTRESFSFSNLEAIKPTTRFQILEQTNRSDSNLSLLVIFNETTTLKIRLKRAYVAGPGDPDAPRLECEENRRSTPNSASDLSNEEKLPFSGKFKIVRMKSLMFAKDPIKNQLFEHTLAYVQNHFWYDTLHRFLELVDLIYSDLVHYYTKVQKEFSTTIQASKIEVQNFKEHLVVEGSIKSAKLSCSTPIFGQRDFKVYPLNEETYAHMPINSNKKLPNKGPMTELSCSLADSVRAFRYFMSTFT